MAIVRNDEPHTGGKIKAVGNDEVAASIKLTMKALKEYLGLKSGSEREKLQFIGSEFGRIVSRGMAPSDSIEEVLEEVRVFWTGHSLGEMEVIRGTPLTFTIRNCYDCIAAQAGDTLCAFKEGFINAIFIEKVAPQATVEETECCGTGASSCRFTVTPIKQ